MSENTDRIRQCRKPLGKEGLVVGNEMNVRHRELWEWGLKHVAISPKNTILDVGFGGGMSLELLSKLAYQGKVYGIDYSHDMTRLAYGLNKELDNLNLINILQGTVDSLPFKNNVFDIVCGFETCYFWPDLEADFKEIYDVLKNNGLLLIVNEVYDHPLFKKRNDEYAKSGSMQINSPDEYRTMLYNAGYSLVKIHELPEKNWITLVAIK